MGFDFLRSVSGSSSGFRVICGEMILDDKWNVHSEVLIAYLKDGSATIETATNAYNVHKGEFYFISPNQKYKIVNHYGAKIDVILLNLSNPAALTQEYIPQSLIRGITTGNCTHFAKITIDNENYNDFLNNFTTVMKSETEKGEFFQLLVHGKMYQIFYILFATGLVQIFDVETQGKKYRALRRITEYINENFCDSVSLDTIAQETGLSRYYISHLFKELMNTTFVNYLNELRLSRAAMLLTTTDTPIIEIAGMSGFNNISNFNRAFKMYYDTTPSKYRRLECHMYK
jgi:AraC-like DNA-binding protein